MSSEIATSDLLAKIEALEKRVVHLEQRLADELPEVPWHVLAAAVAAVDPDCKIVSAKRASESLPFAPFNFWGIGGRLEQFESHRFR